MLVPPALRTRLRPGVTGHSQRAFGHSCKTVGEQILGASSTGGGFLSPAGFREKMSAPFIDMTILHELDDLLHESMDPEPGVNATAGDTLDFRDDSTSSRSITASISRASRRGTSSFNHISVGQDVRGPPTLLLHPLSVAWRTSKPSIAVFNGHSHARPSYA